MDIPRHSKMLLQLKHEVIWLLRAQSLLSHCHAHAESPKPLQDPWGMVRTEFSQLGDVQDPLSQKPTFQCGISNPPDELSKAGWKDKAPS